jgi:cyclase
VRGHRHRVTRLTDGVTVVGDPTGTLGRSNSVVVDDGGSAVVVDTMLIPALTARLHDVLRSRDARADFVVNTHPHVDHVGGNAAFPTASVLAHPVTVAMVTELARDTSFLGGMFPAFATELAELQLRIPAAFDTAPDLPRGARTLALGPAHSPADVAVWLPDDGVLVAGDLCFHGITPLALPGHASIRGWIAALDLCLALDPRAVVPGHGHVATAAALMEVRAYLRILQDVASDTADAVPGDPVTQRAVRRLGAAAPLGWAEPGRHAVNLAVAVAEHNGAPPPSGHRPRLDHPRRPAGRPADGPAAAAAGTSAHSDIDEANRETA